MKEFDWEEFDKGIIAIHCKTKNEANNFLREAKKLRYEWRGGESIFPENNYDMYKEDTYYRADSFGIMVFGNIKAMDSKCSNYTFLEWSDYMKPINTFDLHITCEDGIHTHATLKENDKIYTAEIAKYEKDKFDSEVAVHCVVDKIYEEKDKDLKLKVGGCC